MPIYEYGCEHCGVFEEMQRITDAPLSKCPKCKRKVRRLISQTSFQLKGSGWYVTDYARKSNGAKKTDDGSGTSETKTEGGNTEGGKTEGGKAKGSSAESSKGDAKAESKPSSSGSSEKPTS